MVKIGDSWSKDYMSLDGGLMGEDLIERLNKSLEDMGYSPELNDIDKDTTYTEEIQEEISRYPESSDLKLYRAKGNFFLRSQNLLAVIDPQSEYKKILFVRTLSSLTGKGEEKLNEDFEELKKYFSD